MVVAAVAIASFAAAACTGDGDEPGPTPHPSGSAGGDPQLVAGYPLCAIEGARDLTGAGATFPFPLYSKLIDEYGKLCGTRINYQSIGSGGGIKAITQKTVDFGASGGKYLIELENGVLNHTEGQQASNADATVTLSRDTLNKIILQETKLADAISAGDVKVNGNQAKLTELVSYLDNFEFWFPIVTP